MIPTYEQRPAKAGHTFGGMGMIKNEFLTDAEIAEVERMLQEYTMTEERLYELAESAASASWRFWRRKLEANPKDTLARHGEQMHYDEWRYLFYKLQEIREKSRQE